MPHEYAVYECGSCNKMFFVRLWPYTQRCEAPHKRAQCCHYGQREVKQPVS